MKTNLYKIPFQLVDKTGAIVVSYKANTGPIESGFEIVKDLIPDLNICIGYPTLHAYIEDFSGYGFTKYSGWIQTVKFSFYANLNDTEPKETLNMVDVPPIMQDNGVPFLAYGYPSEMFDAPVNNYSDCPKLVWEANTYFVNMPSHINNNKIECLAQFKWGYIDSINNGKHTIDILPFEIKSKECWYHDLPMLEDKFPKWNFAK